MHEQQVTDKGDDESATGQLGKVREETRDGFTLIELSIVLVIIGLLVGGVLAGQELIKLAEVRATISQLDQINTAVNTFKVKYGCLPGDCGKAMELGLSYDLDAEIGGNGDDMIDVRYEDPDGVNPSFFESATMLIQLSETGLLAGAVGERDGTHLPLKIKGLNTYCNGTASWVTQYAMSDPVVNGHIGHMLVAAGMNGADCSAMLTPYQAYAIDAKVDDGLPRSGVAFATGVNDSGISRVIPPLSEGGPAGADSPYCFTDATPPAYNVTYAGASTQAAGGDGPLCVVILKAAF